MNLRILVLKTEKLSDFLKRRSKLFHSVMIDAKELLKKLRSVFRRRFLHIIEVQYNECLAGTKLKMYLGCSFFKTL